MLATRIQASAEAIVLSKSLASRRRRPSHAKSSPQPICAAALRSPCLVRSLDDLRRKTSDPFQRALQLRASITAICKDMAKPRPSLHGGLEDLCGTIAILDRCAVDDQADQEPAGIGHDLALATVDLLTGIEASDAAAFGGLDGLAVDDAGGRACLPALLLPGRHASVLLMARSTPMSRQA